MKKVLLSVLIIFLLIGSFVYSQQIELSGNKIFSVLSSKYSSNVSTIFKNNKNQYRIRDLSFRKKTIKLYDEMVLAFNTPSPKLIKDDSGKYQVIQAEYSFSKTQGSLGAGAAKFFKHNHNIRLKTERTSWLGSCQDLGSFSIEFRFKPVVLRDNSILFSRIGYFSGNKSGIVIKTHSGKIIVDMPGMFYHAEKKGFKRLHIRLTRGRKLISGKWYHFVLSYNRLSGKLSKRLNGTEEDVIYLSKQGIPYNDVFIPTFGWLKNNGQKRCVDLPNILLGKRYIGYIDEFKISQLDYKTLVRLSPIRNTNFAPLQLSNRVPGNVEGVIVSPVYSFKKTGTKVTRFSWDSILPKNSFIWFEFRISDHNFLYNDKRITWYRIKNNQMNIYLMKQKTGSYLRGKYFQWKAHLIASPDGKYSPSLYNIRLRYQMDVAPSVPRFIEILNNGDRFFTIKWKKNIDHDRKGYKIYYGVTKKRYDGIITHIKGVRITNKMARGGYITLRIDNSIIEENRIRNKHKLLKYPVIKNTILYFCGVSAYDSYRVDTQYNHESIISEPVSVRPFAGSEIK